MDNENLGYLIFFTFVIIMLIITMVSALFYANHLKENCESVGGKSLGSSCIKKIDGKYIQGKVIKYGDKYVFVE